MPDSGTSSSSVSELGLTKESTGTAEITPAGSATLLLVQGRTGAEATGGNDDDADDTAGGAGGGADFKCPFEPDAARSERDEARPPQLLSMIASKNGHVFVPRPLLLSPLLSIIFLYLNTKHRQKFALTLKSDYNLNLILNHVNQPCLVVTIQ